MAAGVSPPTGAVPGADWAVGVPEAGGVVEEVPTPAGAVPGAGCFAAVAEGVSLPTGAVPGACWAEGVLAGGVVPDPVDWAHSPVASASANPASATALELLQAVLMTSPPGWHAGRPAPLDSLDVSIRLFDNRKEE